MKPVIQTVLPAMLGVLMTLALTSRSVAGPDDAPKLPRGIHVQSPKLDPELVRKTKEETDKVIRRGEVLWKDRLLGTNGQNCNMCHPNGAATHPETFPKFKQQFGRVVTVQEFINWCIVAAMRGDSREIGSEDLTALEAYQAYESRGQVMEIGVPGP
jgi:thiosulfate dehydrogenase